MHGCSCGGARAGVKLRLEGNTSWNVETCLPAAVLPASCLPRSRNRRQRRRRDCPRWIGLADKKVRITAEVDSPPFGIIGSDGQPDGSEIATARQLAKDLVPSWSSCR